MEKGKPYQSKLREHEDFIKSERKRGISYREIAAKMKEEFGVSVHRDTIHSFVKVRAKRKKCFEIKDRFSVERSLTIKEKRNNGKEETDFDFTKFLEKKQLMKNNENLFEYDPNKPIR